MLCFGRLEMTSLNRKYIKKKIIQIDPKRWWGDDFDVRFLLISKLIKINNKTILDLGGGIGIILSQLDQSNRKINLDLSFNDLVTCRNKNNAEINNVCGSMTHLPFKENSLDYVIAANILEVGKEKDVKDNIDKNEFPTIMKTMNEIKKITKIDGCVFLTTPNNEYYKTIKLSFDELKSSIIPFFSEFIILFYNTYPRISHKFRKLNMANVIPKLLSKIKNDESIIYSLCKTKSQNNYSVSFFVEIRNR